MKVDFEREKRWWNAKAPGEKEDSADAAINRALRWREIERRLDGVRTILEVGGGTGVFSIPLARRGFHVTHLDISPEMLSRARTNAGDLSSITFVEGNAVDLFQFHDRSFDLVLNMDGAISFCGEEAEQAVFESCRVTRKTLLLTVSHRAWMTPVWVETSLQVSDGILPAVYEMLGSGRWHQEQFSDNPLMSAGAPEDYIGAFKAFLPAELCALLKRAGMQVLHCGGLGSLAHLLERETVERILDEPQLLEEFLDLCERYDREILPEGIGTRARSGLIAVAERPDS